MEQRELASMAFKRRIAVTGRFGPEDAEHQPECDGRKDEAAYRLTDQHARRAEPRPEEQNERDRSKRVASAQCDPDQCRWSILHGHLG